MRLALISVISAALLSAAAEAAPVGGAARQADRATAELFEPPADPASSPYLGRDNPTGGPVERPYAPLTLDDRARASGNAFGRMLASGLLVALVLGWLIISGLRKR
jgi:hypothetical protein